MAVLEVGRVPIGLVTPLRFKWLDSQPEMSNMGPVPTDVHDFCDFLKSWGGFLTRYLSCFRPGCFTIQFFQFSVGIKQNRDEKLCRFVVVSPRGVPSLTVSGPFKILMFRSFLLAPSICLSNSGSLVFTKIGHQPYHLNTLEKSSSGGSTS